MSDSVFYIPIEKVSQHPTLPERQQYQVCVVCIAQCLTLGIRLKQFKYYLNIPGFSETHLFRDVDAQDESSHLLLKCRYGQERPVIGNVLEAQTVRLVLRMLETCQIEIKYFEEVFAEVNTTV